MRLVQDGAAGSLVYAAALHADQTVLDDIEQTDTVLAAQLVELEDDILRGHLLAVEGDGSALFKFDGDISRLVGGVDRGYAHLEEAGLLICRLVVGILEVKALMAQVPQVLILRVVGLTVDLEGDVMRLGILDLFLTGLDVPDTPRSDDGHVGSEVLDRQLETNLIVALAGTAVADRVGAFLESDLDKTLRDAGTRGRGTQQVFLIDSARLHGGDDEIVDILLGLVEDIELGRAGFERLFLQTLELVVLTDVAGYRDDLAVIVVLFEPRDDDGCVQTARISENDFLDVFLVDSLHGDTSE